MNENEQGLYAYLKQMREFHVGREAMKRWTYFGMDDLLIRKGRWYTPQALPKGYEFGPIKQCFNNSWRLAMESKITHDKRDLRYVEGVVHAIIPVHHAWVTDRDGNVIDPTLRDAAHAYVGIEFSLAAVSKALMKGATMLDDWMGKDGYAIFRKPFKQHFKNLRGREVANEIGVREVDRDAAAVDEAG